MTKSCIFCQIAKREMPADVVYEDKFVTAFKDIAPKAPIHILVVPKKHIETVDDIAEIDQHLVGHMVMVAQKIAREQKISATGYRLVFNVRHHGGQIVDHIHLHILGGKKLGSMA